MTRSVAVGGISLCILLLLLFTGISHGAGEAKQKLKTLPASTKNVEAASLGANALRQSSASRTSTPPNSPPESYPDPIPLRRLLLADDAIGTRSLSGVWRRLALSDFEGKVRAAAQEAHARQWPPRIVESRYRAVWTPGRLEGEGRWQIVNPSRAAALLRLDPLQLAIGLPMWSDSRDERVAPQPAKLFRPPAEAGGGVEAGAAKTAGRPQNPLALALLETQAGRVTFPWSVRGIEEPDEERFELAVPASPLAELEVRVPAERFCTSPTPGVFTTGPFPTEKGDEKLWRLSFGGRSKLDLTVRKSSTGDTPAMFHFARFGRYHIRPGELNATFELRLEASRGRSVETRWIVDPGLVIKDVAGDRVERWRFQPGSGAAASGANPVANGTLVVDSREATGTERLTITATAAFPVLGGTWTPPMIRLQPGVGQAVGGTIGADSIEAIVSPEFKFEGWAAGDYRPVSGGLETVASRPVNDGVLSERPYKIGFVATTTPFPVEDRFERRLPSIRVRPNTTDVSTEESLVWRLEPGSNRLSARLKIRVVTGPIPSFVVQLAPGYRIDSADTTPDDAGLVWQQTGGPNTWLIEPSRAVPSGETILLHAEIQGPAVPAATDPAATSAQVVLPFPRFVISAASERQGVLQIRPSRIRLTTGGVPVSMTNASELTLPFRGREPEGEVVAVADAFAARTTVSTLVAAQDGRFALRSEIRTETDEPVRSLTVYTPPGGTITTDDRNASVERVPVASVAPWLGLPPWGGASSAVAAAAIDRAFPGNYSRVVLPRPTRGPILIRESRTLPKSVHGEGGSVEFARVLGASSDNPVVTFDSTAAERFELPAAKTSAAEVRLRIKGRAAAGVARTAPPESADVQNWHYSDLKLQTILEADGRLDCRMSGKIMERGGNRWSFTLPPNADAIAMTFAGKLVDHPRVTDQQVEVELPPGKVIPFEIEYRVRDSIRDDWHQSQSPAPGLPGAESIPIERRWSIAPGRTTWPMLETADCVFDDGEAVVTLPTGLVTAATYILLALLLGGIVTSLAYDRMSVWLVFAVFEFVLGMVLWLAPPGWSSVVRPAFAILGLGLVLAGRRNGDAAKTAAQSQAKGDVTSVRASSRKSSRPMTTPAVVLAVFLLGRAVAQTPEPTTVLIVPTAQGSPEPYAVLAPAEVIDRLTSLASPPVQAVVLVSAEYTGMATSGGAQFEAKYTLDVSVSGDQSFSFPLSGARLESAFLDGKDAYPEAVRPDRYTVAIRGAGKHELVVRFAVAPSAASVEREVRLGIADSPVCKVSFVAGLRGRLVDVPSRLGGQTVRFTTNGPVVEADHGSGTELVVRWREGLADGSKPSITVREACVWDLSETDARQTAAFLYRIDGGTISQFKIEMPESLEPGNLRVSPLDPRAAGVGVREWRTGKPANGWVPITVRLQSPTDGRLLVTVTGTTRRPTSLRPVLRFARAADVTDADSFYAIRYETLTPQSITLTGLIDFPAEAMVREFAGVPELAFEKSPPERVVRRLGTGVPEFRPVLQNPVVYTPGGTEVLYSFGRRLEVEGAMKATRTTAGLVEFDIPSAIKLQDVRSPGLAGWSRNGSRVQLWWNEPSPEVLVRWSGTLPVDLFPISKSSHTLDLALPRWPSAVAALAGPPTVRLRTTEGWAVTAVPSPGLVAKPNSGAAGERVYIVSSEPGVNPTMKVSLNRTTRTIEPSPRNPLPPKTTPGTSVNPPVSVEPITENLAADNSARPEHTGDHRIVWSVFWVLAVIGLTLGTYRDLGPRRNLLPTGWALACAVALGWSTPIVWLFAILAALFAFAPMARLANRAIQLLAR